MKKLMLVASTLMIGTMGTAFAAGDETGGGLTNPDGVRTTSTYSQPAPAPETKPEEMTLLEYFLQLLREYEG